MWEFIEIPTQGGAGPMEALAPRCTPGTLPVVEAEPFITFDVFVGLYRPRLYRIAVLRVGPEEAEDVTQDALLRIWRHFNVLRDPEARLAWAQTITVNVAKSRARGNGKRPVCLEAAEEERDAGLGADGVEQAALARLAAEDVRRAMAELTDAQRPVVRLHGLEGRSLLEIAQELGIPVGAVRKRWWDGKAALLRRLVALGGR